MPQARPAIFLALAGFFVALIATLPLRWAVKALPEGIECAVPAGTVWRGQCAALRAGTVAVGTTQWSVRARELLLGRLAADVSLSQPGLRIDTRVVRTFTGELQARDLRGDLQLGFGPLERLAPALRGALRLDLQEVVVREGWVRALLGTIVAAELQQISPQPMALGNYTIEFREPPAADGRIVGQLRDRGGPLDVQGTLALLPQPGYELTGSVSARADAPPQVAEQIRFLGSPDAAGRRAFSQSETF